MKNKVCIAVFALLSTLSLFAMGGGETQSSSVKDPAGFKEKVDINEKKPGKYNFYIEAHDKGGNVTLAGPHNIYIDPESDLPIIGITNPRENMRIPGNLNIVGTCVDDDAVGYVELMFNDDESKVVKAEGAEFWSYYLDTSAMGDDIYSITAWGVDVNGLKGRPQRVQWNLDRKKPVTGVDSHKLGSLVSGKINLKGTVLDGNGIEALEYSLDNGVTFLPVKIDHNKKERTASFALPVDTKLFKDGPAVIWFKARDRQGTAGIYSYLMYVDNTKPDVRVVYPMAETAVNGIFTVSGYAQDVVGLTSLSWTLGKETGEFPLTVGNPWWVKTFDIRGVNASSLELVIRAVDVSGNVTIEKRKIPVDQAADLPVVTLVDPTPSAVFMGTEVALSGLVKDDDGVESVFWSLDGGDPVEIRSSGAFQVLLKDIPPGLHSFQVWAKDVTGIEGPKAQALGVVVAGDVPVLEIASIVKGSGSKDAESADYVSGMEIHPESGSALALKVQSGSAIKTLSWTIGSSPARSVDLKPKGVDGGELTHEIVFPADSGYGQVTIHLEATDIHGRVGVLDDLVKVTDLTSARGEPAVVFEDVRIAEDGTVRLDPKYPFTGYVLGANASDAKLTKRSAVVRLVREGNFLRVEGGDSAGTETDIAIEVKTDRGFTYRSRSFNFINPDPSDVPASSIRIESIDGRPWMAGLSFAIPLTAKKGPTVVAVVDSTVPANSVVWSVAGRTGLKGSVKKLPGGSQELSLTLPSDIPASRVPILVEASFKNAETLRASGEFVIVRPAEGVTVNVKESFVWSGPVTLPDGTILMDRVRRLSGFYNGRPVKKATFDKSADGLSLSVEDGRILLSATKDGRYNGVQLVITDVDGWTFKTESYRFLVDGAVPEVALVENVDGTWVKNNVRVNVTAKDSNALKPLEYSLDLGRTWQRLASNRETIDISALEDGVVAMSVRVIDEAGKQGFVSFSVLKDTAAPKAEVVVPVAEARVNGEIRMGLAVADAGKIVKVEYEGRNKVRVPLDPAPFIDFMIGTATVPLADGMKFHFEDAAGNSFTLDTFPFVIDQEMDLPVVEVNFPEDNEVITTDFVVSGIIYDDDKPAKVWYKIDDAKEIAVDAENAYSIPVALSSLTDNEHKVTVIAEDVYGVRGKPITRNFRVSLEEPKAKVLKPEFDQTVRGVVEISGVASDKNGIERIRVSLDNGNTFNDAVGTTEWKYRFDSLILKDGTHVVFIKVWDKYGIEGLYSSLINVDNTAPDIYLEYPLDGMVTTGPVFVSGQATDTISLETITMNLRSLKGAKIPDELAEMALKPDSILKRDLDLSKLPDGLYNLDIRATDSAMNVTHVSRNIRLEKENQRNFIECLYPLDGEFVNGSFNLYGYLGGTDTASTVSLILNGNAIETVSVTPAGYFRFSLDGTKIPAGKQTLTVRSDFNGKQMVASVPRTINYSASGAWVTVDSLAMGDFAFQRPWLTGRAGFTPTDEDLALLENKEADKKAVKAVREKLNAAEVAKVELSFDNGKTFFEVEYDEQWMYRLETQDMTEGMHYLVVRSTLVSGERAVTRMVVQIDKTSPHIKLIAPESGGRYNQEMEFTALVNDDIELGDVQYVLRKGDKSAYEIPGFIQGLYFDFHFWGGTFYDVGMGLTFFDDNVKLQVQYGQLTESQWATFSDGPMRFGENVFGAKLLANILYMPFSYFLGPDWSWLSSSLALGANYSYFSKTQSGKAQMLSAVLAQLEFPRITVEKWKMFRTYSFYTEFQLWFIPTDVDTSVVNVDTLVPHVAVGLRMNVF